MEEHDRIIPEVVLRHKKPADRPKIFEKYYARYRRSKVITGLWWLLLGDFGAHRVYLKQYRAAVILFIIGFLVLATAASMGSRDLLIILAVIRLIELMLLPMNIGKANDLIRDRLKEDIDSVSYIPLS